MKVGCGAVPVVVGRGCRGERALGDVARQPVDVARLNTYVRQLPTIEIPELAGGDPRIAPSLERSLGGADSLACTLDQRWALGDGTACAAIYCFT